MYHIELRQFPHNFSRFNLTERELRETVLDGWVHGEWIELGERRWNPHQAKLTVIEGPQLAVQQLSMGRGWRNAVREGSDVTERMLATARATAASVGSGAFPELTAVVQEQSRIARGAPAVGEVDPAFDARLAADSLGLETLARLGSEPVQLVILWRLARERYPELAAGDCLRLAEGTIHSLLEARLAVLLIADDKGEQESCESPEQIERALLAIDSWASTGSAVWLRKT